MRNQFHIAALYSVVDYGQFDGKRYIANIIARLIQYMRAILAYNHIIFYGYIPLAINTGSMRQPVQ